MSLSTRLMIAAGLIVLAAAGCSPGAGGAEPSGSAPGSGVVQGHLYGVGGPPPGTRQAWTGTVSFDGGGTHADVAVKDDGSYSIALGPGRYTVAGSSPRYQDGKQACSPATGAVEVTAGSTTTVDVLCQMR
ncbi:hypothetical protein ODJ79_02405 [Actinoplanes sp. KI2]|uniref:hypothetical protein n=1 Tax=Actinoplanes sp. KI2 TaxID=2983315 RepID=UPI0021D5E1D0|nr:hypothetical protein [Actinoplanes sp. KI2]MCU7722557.1 hypothetical protein [Actinoplanes sp. KI2]